MDEELFEANLVGDTQRVKMLLESGADANARTKERHFVYDHILIIAVQFGHTDIVRLLLDYGADINIRDHRDDTPLLVAMEWQKYHLIPMLIARGASANVENRNGETCLTLLYPRRLRCHEQFTPERPSIPGWFHEKQEEIVTWYLRRKLKRLLREAGGDCYDADPEHRRRGATQRFYRAYPSESGRPDFKAAKAAIEAGADVNANKGAPIHFAADTWDAEAVRLLIQRGANPNSVIHEIAGRQSASETMLRVVLDGKADIDYTDEEGKTPLHVAVLNMSPIHVNYLLRRGANVYAHSHNGWNVFRWLQEGAGRGYLQIDGLDGIGYRLLDFFIRLVYWWHMPRIGWPKNETDVIGKLLLAAWKRQETR